MVHTNCERMLTEILARFIILLRFFSLILRLFSSTRNLALVFFSGCSAGYLPTVDGLRLHSERSLYARVESRARTARGL